MLFKTELTTFGQVLIVLAVLAVAVAIICAAAESAHPRRVLHKSDRLTILCIAHTAGACDQVKIRIQNKEAGNAKSR